MFISHKLLLPGTSLALQRGGGLDMNRRNVDRRVVEKPSKALLILTSLTLVVSVLSLVVSLNNRVEKAVAASNSIDPTGISNEVQELKQAEEKPAVIPKARPKVETKRHSKERVSRGPKRVKVIFEESVARAPAAVAPPSDQGPKTIKYSNDLYEKEDLL